MWKIYQVLWIGLIFISGCATPIPGEVRINEVSGSITEIQKIVIKELPLGTRKQSQNGREYYSNYFVMKSGGEFEDAETAVARQSISITILGDRRPYDLLILAPTEKRDSSGNYVFIRNDQRLATVISRRIQKTLNERREDRNIIDDFRAF